MRSSKLVIKIDAQKQMAKYGFGCKFHDDHKFFEVGCFRIP